VTSVRVSAMHGLSMLCQARSCRCQYVICNGRCTTFFQCL